jgi:hypothetical protein
VLQILLILVANVLPDIVLRAGHPDGQHIDAVRQSSILYSPVAVLVALYTDPVEAFLA